MRVSIDHNWCPIFIGRFRAGGGINGRRTDYQLRLTGHEARIAYGERIGFLSDRKRAAFADYRATGSRRTIGILLTLPDDADIMALQPAVYAAWRARHGAIPDSLGEFFRRYTRGCRTITAGRARWLLDLLPSDSDRSPVPFLREALDAGYHEVRVIEARSAGRERVIALAVEGDCSYIAHGVVVHDVGVSFVPGQRDEHPQDAGHDERLDVVDRATPEISDIEPMIPVDTPSLVAADTVVTTERGLVLIESVFPGEMIVTARGVRRVLMVQVMNARESVTMKLSNGMSLRCHPAQSIRSVDTWIEAKNLTAGVPVYSAVPPGMFGHHRHLHLRHSTERPMNVWSMNEVRLPSDWTVELAEFVGYLLAHGQFASKNGIAESVTLTFAPADADLMEHFAPIIRRVFGREPVERRRASPQLRIYSKDVAGAMEQLGIDRKIAGRRIPGGVFAAPEPIMAAVLRGYFEGRVRMAGESGAQTLSLNAANPGIASDIQLLLRNFGITSNCISRPARRQTSKRGATRTDTVNVVGYVSKRAFIERIGFLSQRRRAQAARLLQRSEGVAERYEGRGELLTLSPDCDMRALKQAVVRERQPASCSLERCAQLEEVRQFISAHISGRKRFLTFMRAEWIVTTVPERILAEHAPFLLEAVNGRYVEAYVDEIRSEPAGPMVAILIEGGDYLAQGVVVRDARSPSVP